MGTVGPLARPGSFPDWAEGRALGMEGPHWGEGRECVVVAEDGRRRLAGFKTDAQHPWFIPREAADRAWPCSVSELKA